MGFSSILLPRRCCRLALVAGYYCCLLLHELAHLQAARWVRLGVRSLRIYPYGSSPKLMEISERPWKEIWVAAAGPVAHALIAALLALALTTNDVDLSPNFESAEPFWPSFFNRLFWLNVLLAVLHLVPAFPLDGGQIFRGASRYPRNGCEPPKSPACSVPLSRFSF